MLRLLQQQMLVINATLKVTFIAAYTTRGGTQNLEPINHAQPGFEPGMWRTLTMLIT